MNLLQQTAHVIAAVEHSSDRHRPPELFQVLVAVAIAEEFFDERYQRPRFRNLEIVQCKQRQVFPRRDDLAEVRSKVLAHVLERWGSIGSHRFNPCWSAKPSGRSSPYRLPWFVG